MNRPEKDDYPELTGKEIEMIIKDDYAIGIVQGVNFDIGISIAKKGNPNQYLVCMPGPSVKDFQDCEYSSNKYEKIFASVVTELEDGIYTGEWKKYLPNYYYPDGRSIHRGPMASCPWS